MYSLVVKEVLSSTLVVCIISMYTVRVVYTFCIIIIIIILILL